MEEMGAAYTVVFALVACACAYRARRDASQRLPWTVATAGVVVWGTADAIYRFQPDPSAPYPPATQMLLGVAFVLGTTTVVLLSRHRVRRLRIDLLLDGLIAGLAAAAITSVVLFPALARAQDRGLGGDAPPGAYLLASLAALGYVIVSIALTGWRPGRGWGLMCTSIAVNTVGQVALVEAYASGHPHRGGLADILFAASVLLLGAAALTPLPPLEGRVARGGRLNAVPAVAALAMIVLLFASTFTPVDGVACALAAASLALVVARTVMAFRENGRLLEARTREALTDGLTGLGNRRLLLADLDAAIADGAREHTLVLYDLDGFKTYNDAFGHPAGDALLARLGERFAAALEPDHAYRIGGDEFCALIAGPPARAVVAVDAARAALEETGDGFAITSSWGAVTLGGEVGTSTHALQEADARMYAQKDSQRRPAHRQTRDALLQVLREREPDLDEHLRGVARAAAAVARLMGLEDRRLEEVVRGAELHDIGKMAVPDEILHKPGALTTEEWGFIRQHTIVGERILAAAPDLVGVARLVRSSHERWDGNGYPDGLEGGQIPLGARIIAVCDAFDAMTSERPYSQPMSGAAAVDELWRCAGGQFDPAVVAAFATEVANGTVRPRAADQPA
jgi:two-component system cell cycle response regulator